MFLKELTEDQQKIFMALAKRTVLADWRLEDHEKEAIARVEAELGKSFEVEARDLLTNDNLVVLDSNATRRIAMYELMVMAQADLKIDASERHIFDDLADELKIDQATMDTLEELSVDGYSLIMVNGNDTEHRAKVRAIIDA